MPNITGRTRLPDQSTPTRGTWSARAIDERGGVPDGADILVGVKRATDAGSGASMTLKAGWYTVWFRASGRTEGGMPLVLGPWAVNVSADTTWGAIIASQPVGVPPTPTVAQQLAAAIAAKPDLPSGGAEGQTLSKAGSGLAWSNPAASVPDATTDAAGKVRLAAAATDVNRVPLVALVVTMLNALETKLTNGAPGALDTLDELAAALGDDANFAATVTNALAAKVTRPSGGTDGQALLRSGTGVVWGDVAAGGGTVTWVKQNPGGTWPARPTSSAAVKVFWDWVTGNPPAEVTSGTGGALRGVDVIMRVPA